MHYAVPRILQEAGLLEHFYTDFAANCGWPRMLNSMPTAFRPPAVQRLLGRVAEGVPADRITAFNLFGLRYARQLQRSLTPTAHTSAFLWSGKEFCRQVLVKGFGSANAVYTFNTAGFEILQRARQRGLLAVMEQTIAPKNAEMELLSIERARFGEWEPDGGQDALAQDLAQREAAEWKEAHLILCACDFVRDGIARCGGPVGKCVVIPYGVDVVDQGSEVRGQRSEMGDRPLRVLTVGSVGLRKGSPYVLEAARQLKGKAQFRMVGSIGVEHEAEIKLREYVELTGAAPRSEVARHFESADVFLLPSICEGSATVTYEALAYGLPVICTANTGSVVRDGIEGFIVPIRDAAAIAERLQQLLDDSELLERMSANAAARAKEFTVAKYGDRLTSALRMSFPIEV